MECTRTVLFPGKLSNQYPENLEISPSTCNPLLGSEWPTGTQSSSAREQFVELTLLYKLCPAIAGLKAGVKKQRQSKCITYVTLNYDTTLQPPLLTLFFCVRTEQYHRLLSCYTTATSLTPVIQQWRLNLWTLDF